jgi:hypothetical protein
LRLKWRVRENIGKAITMAEVNFESESTQSSTDSDGQGYQQKLVNDFHFTLPRIQAMLTDPYIQPLNQVLKKCDAGDFHYAVLKKCNYSENGNAMKYAARQRIACYVPFDIEKDFVELKKSNPYQALYLYCQKYQLNEYQKEIVKKYNLSENDLKGRYWIYDQISVDALEYCCSARKMPIKDALAEIEGLGFAHQWAIVKGFKREDVVHLEDYHATALLWWNETRPSLVEAIKGVDWFNSDRHIFVIEALLDTDDSGEAKYGKLSDKVLLALCQTSCYCSWWYLKYTDSNDNEQDAADIVFHLKNDAERLLWLKKKIVNHDLKYYLKPNSSSTEEVDEKEKDRLQQRFVYRALRYNSLPIEDLSFDNLAALDKAQEKLLEYICQLPEARKKRALSWILNKTDPVPQEKLMEQKHTRPFYDFFRTPTKEGKEKEVLVKAQEVFKHLQ